MSQSSMHLIPKHAVIIVILLCQYNCQHAFDYMGMQHLHMHLRIMAFQIVKLSIIISIPAPSIVVYDNACNLHQFCLNREPDFFKETRFLVD